MAQRLRLLSGLVLFTYVSTHLLNHALGLASLAAAEAGRGWFLAVWRHPLGTLLLYGSLLTHLALVLWALYQRRHLRLPRWELIRLGLGLLIPILLLHHALGTRLSVELGGIADTYTRQVSLYWLVNPRLGAQQLLLLTIAWIHGCMGIHYWLRVKRWHTVTVPTLRQLGVLVPLLAVGGVVDIGQEVAARAAEDPGWLRAAYQPLPPPDGATVAWWQDTAVGGYLGLVGLVLVARRARTIWHRRRGVIRLLYPGGRTVTITPGATLLEASRAAGIPHVSLCGGRGRCSTCRTRLSGLLDRLPPPSASEARVLARVGAPPDVRLACQLRPTTDLRVFPLVPPDSGPTGSLLALGRSQGDEREVAILFADIRGYSRFAEQRLPFDVVFVLDQYFAAMGGAIEGAGGYLDKFIGDGIMAIFGAEHGPADGCRRALDAAARMLEALDRLNASLESDLDAPLRIGIGIHVGQAIVGRLGYGHARTLTAIGDVVNVASRLESLTKDFGVPLVASEEVGRLAGVDLGAASPREADVRGRAGSVPVRAVSDVAALRAALAAH